MEKKSSDAYKITSSKTQRGNIIPEHIITFTNKIPSMKTGPEKTEAVRAVRLTEVKKTDGKFSKIAISETLRRIITKVISKQMGGRGKICDRLNSMPRPAIFII